MAHECGCAAYAAGGTASCLSLSILPNMMTALPSQTGAFSPAKTGR